MFLLILKKSKYVKKYIKKLYEKKICENHEYCNIEMPSPNNNIIK